ncbi:hypothetical protein ACQEVB_38740 [Pseudonocardia sp. CA-107938]|uniref:hypothetical protein n=1 Tax=Pseudonocardia sp. CA-107938 TaxID=3240021 RepID=UPI003D8CB747
MQPHRIERDRALCHRIYLSFCSPAGTASAAPTSFVPRLPVSPVPASSALPLVESPPAAAGRRSGAAVGIGAVGQGMAQHRGIGDHVEVLPEERDGHLGGRRLTSGVLRSAVRDRLISHNPSDGVRVPRRRRSDTDDQVISRSVLRNRLRPVVPVQHRAVVAIAAGAGLRWGEAIGVGEDVLDLDRRVVHVRRTVIEVA